MAAFSKQTVVAFPEKWNIFEKKINMRKIIPVILILLNVRLVAQEKKEIIVKTEVKAVTIFTKAAQPTRKKTVELPAGKSLVKFTDLSPYIDEKSIQIKTSNEVIVLSVNYQLNYIDTTQKAQNVQDLRTKLEAVESKLFLESTNLEVIKEELEFLKDNRVIGGKNQELSLANLKQTADYYHERITALKMREIEVNKNIGILTKQKDGWVNQITQDGVSKTTPQGEVVVKVDAKTPVACEFELQYVVNNAGWYPTYDIRSRTIEEPVELTYKANIHQNTKENWKNVQIRLSSSDPNLGSVAPELKTYFLDYYTAPPTYSNISYISGKVYDMVTGESIPGATVLIEGTTIATSTNMQGEFYLTITPDAKTVVISAIGYENQKRGISGSSMDISMQESSTRLEEVEVVAYGISKEKKSLGYSTQSIAGKVAGVSSNSALASKKKTIAPVEQIENQTSIDFDVKTPYTINSDNKNITVDMDVYALTTTYEYYCVPKIDKDAFLIANVLDWEKYNLLAGEANIFFENTFVGKSILDIRHVSDTLKISLGRDRNIVVKREKIKDYTTRQFIGAKKEETKAWHIAVKNNKKQTVNMLVYDQVPVSTNEEIEVTTETASGGDLNKESGEVKWKFKLDPLAKKEMTLKYKVKYPKEKILTVE